MVGIAAALAGCLLWLLGGQAAQPAPVVDIAIVERDADEATWGFAPAQVRLPAGAIVRWTNHGRVEHNVWADQLGLNSAILGPGEAAEYITGATGRFEYQCGLHPTMVGALVVD